MKHEIYRYLMLMAADGSQNRTELEAETLPLVFTSNGKRLHNYRIYGDSIERKNLLRNIAESQSLFTVNSDKSVTVDGTADSNKFLPLNSSAYDNYVEMPFEDGQTYILSGCPQGGSAAGYALYIRLYKDGAFTYKTDTGSGVEFTHEDGTTYSVYIRIGTGTEIDGKTFYPMIRKSGESSDYETYIENVAVGDFDGNQYAIPVIISGKNLYDSETYPLQSGIVVYGDDGTTTNTSSFASTGFIPCTDLQGQTLTLNKRPGGKKAGIAFYDGEQVYVDGIMNNNATAGTPISFSVPDNAVYMRFSVPNSNKDEIQLEKGASSTAYELYHAPQTVTITLDTPLAGGQYIDFMRDSLPPITPFDGTNILTVGTTVQPSKVYVQGGVAEVVTVSLQTLQLAPRVSTLDIDDGLQLDVMPVEIPVQLNEISPTIGGDESAE